jgi:hypothetical protein
MRSGPAFDALLRQALDRSSVPTPFRIDVADRVMACVVDLGPVPRAEIDLRQFGLWAIAASIAGVGLFVAASWHAPSFADLVHGLSRTTAGTAATALELRAPAGALAGALGRVVMALWASAQALARPLEPIQPFAHATIATITAVMLGVTTFVVGRDVRARVADKEQA